MPSLTPEVSVVDQAVTPATMTEHDGSPTWITRGSNFVVAITRVRSGTCLPIDDSADEYMTFLPNCGARITAGPGHIDVTKDTLVIAPPGSSHLEALDDGWILRCFTSGHTKLLELAVNSIEFAIPRPEVAPPREWPAPPEGYRLRAYHLPDLLSNEHPSWAFQSSNMMINVIARHGPRDVRALSPHSHADFEQASISLSGAWLHHIRYPWTRDMTTWRGDQTLAVGSPSVTVIPPPVVHTSRNIGMEPALLVDFFVPPRLDFAKRPGLVRNASEYPLPKN
jgi:hypothetical protein